MEKDERCCGNCATFSNEDTNGVGWCDKKNKPRSCYQFCKEHKLRQERDVNMKENSKGIDRIHGLDERFQCSKCRYIG